MLGKSKSVATHRRKTTTCNCKHPRLGGTLKGQRKGWRMQGCEDGVHPVRPSSGCGHGLGPERCGGEQQIYSILGPNGQACLVTGMNIKRLSSAKFSCASKCEGPEETTDTFTNEVSRVGKPCYDKAQRRKKHIVINRHDNDNVCKSVRVCACLCDCASYLTTFTRSPESWRYARLSHGWRACIARGYRA